MLSLIPRALSILAIVSLLVSPMMTSPGAAAVGVTAAGVSDSADVSDSAIAADGVPCSHEKPVLPDCAKCPLALLCLAKCFPSAPAAWAFVVTRFAVAVVRKPGDELWRDLPAEPPPLKPPRA